MANQTGKLRLGVNIDHVATVRNARGSAYPDPVRAALLAEQAGAEFYRQRMTEGIHRFARAQPIRRLI